MERKSKIEVIAEIAQGYEGHPKLAELLTVGALASGADAIKYQLVYVDELATPDYLYYELFKSLEMSTDVWKNICNTIHAKNKKLYFDVFGMQSLSVAKKVQADGVKIHTTDFYNRDLIVNAINNFDKVFISIGGIQLEDIDLLVNEILFDHCEQICLLYGFQSEPTPLNQNNLLKFESFKERYSDFNFGFMDHADGGKDEAQQLSLVALGMGITAIEKHLTLDRLLKIEDYVSGISPDDFKKFVKMVKKYESALGTPSLKLSDLEIQYGKKAIKIVVANKDLKQGSKIELNDITLKRCGAIKNGEPIRQIEKVLNKTLKEDISMNNPIFMGQI